MGRRYDTISFLSDLGTGSEHVGVVKAVLRDMAPHALVIDLTHDVPMFDTRAGSLSLARSIGYLPEGVVLGVVDPGTGTTRKGVAIEVAGGGGVLVGPDTGLLAPAVAMAGGAERAVVLSNDAFHLAGPGTTFAGRDVFAPVAAHLCNGVDLLDLGQLIEAELLMPGMVPLPRDEGDSVVCEVVWVDRFGNCQLNIGPDEIAAFGDRVRITVGDANDPTVRVAARAGTFGDVTVGAVGLVVDSAGMIAVVLDRRSAADELGIATGDPVTLSPLGDEPSAGLAAPVSTPVASPTVVRRT